MLKNCFNASDELLDAVVTTLSELKGPWRKIQTRPMDEEERAFWEGRLLTNMDGGIIYTNIPDDGEPVFVWRKSGLVEMDEFINDDDGCSFDSGVDIEDVEAWMSIPQIRWQDIV